MILTVKHFHLQSRIRWYLPTTSSTKHCIRSVCLPQTHNVQQRCLASNDFTRPSTANLPFNMTLFLTLARSSLSVTASPAHPRSAGTRLNTCAPGSACVRVRGRGTWDTCTRGPTRKTNATRSVPLDLQTHCTPTGKEPTPPTTAACDISRECCLGVAPAHWVRSVATAVTAAGMGPWGAEDSSPPDR